MFRLDGKSAVITGAGSGIGESIAEVFAKQGAEVHILDVVAENGERVARQICESGGKAVFHLCDVSKQQDVERVFNEVFEQAGALDILVNNAGVSHIGTVETTSEEDLDRLYAVNIKGVYNGLKFGVEKMLAGGGGVILNMASVASTQGIPDRFGYSMSKGAVYNMTLSIAADYVTKGVRCNCICPARVHTPFVDNYPGQEQEMFDKLSKTAPIGRMAKPQDIASLAVYLCSEESSFVTGGAYYIDGGMSLLRC